MKILYFSHFDNLNSNHIEEAIKKAFEDLGHEVVAVHEKDWRKLSGIKADMFLFHKAGVGTHIDLFRFIEILNHITCKKVCWYLDKVFGDREDYIEGIAEYIDYGFLVDDTWRRRHKFDNFHCLREGVIDSYIGNPKDEYKCDVAYAGSTYGDREEFVRTLMGYYGNRFKVFNDIFGTELADLHASAKVIVAPKFPSDEFYWSSRFYLTLGSRGFLVHPDLYGLKEEFEEGKHFAGYKGMNELIPTIDYFLEHEEERLSIQQQGYKRCLEVATIKHRVKQILEHGK